jgi:non-canonical poly(A) RNA polymerase PAPD5/7
MVNGEWSMVRKLPRKQEDKIEYSKWYCRSKCELWLLRRLIYLGSQLNNYFSFSSRAQNLDTTSVALFTMATPKTASGPDEDEWKDDDFLSLEVENKVPVERDAGIETETPSASAVDGALKSSRFGGQQSEGRPQTSAGPPPPPWVDNDRTMSATDSRRFHPLAVLHNEIVGFVRLMEPLPEEIQQREELVKAVEKLILETFPDEVTAVEVFGSQATGLFLPSSDIDLVVYTVEGQNKDAATTTTTEQTNKKKNKKSKKNKKNKKDPADDSPDEVDDVDVDLEKDWDKPTGAPLERLAAALREKWMSDISYLEVIANTRVPLIKFCHAPTGTQVDVCFDQPTGPPAAVLMKTYLSALPPLRPLTFFLKYFLAARGLNEPYSGGVGSFMLQLMIVGFLQHRERDAVNYRRPSLNNLGCMLLEFLELYGMQFNYMTTGMSIRHDGFFFPKGAADKKEMFWQPSRPFSMALENPLDTTADVGKSSFRIGMVQRAFAVAFRMLLAHTAAPLEPTANGSILETILPPTDEMRTRAAMRQRIAEERPSKRQKTSR